MNTTLPRRAALSADPSPTRHRRGRAESLLGRAVQAYFSPFTRWTTPAAPAGRTGMISAPAASLLCILLFSGPAGWSVVAPVAVWTACAALYRQRRLSSGQERNSLNSRR